MKLFIGLIIIAMLVLSACSSSGWNISDSQKADLAKCLTEKGVVMYGAFWCPHCARTKARFGAAFKEIKYVECDPKGENEQSLLCIDKNIDKYDTWEFADGSRLISEPTYIQLAEKAGCPVPEAK